VILPFSDVASVISGAIVGFVLGLIGGGGSVFATPLLVYFVGVSDPHIAIGTGATAVAVNALVNLAGRARAGQVKWPCAAVFAVSGFLGAAAGSTLGKLFDGQKLLVLFGMVMLVIAAQMGFAKGAAQDKEVKMTAANARKMAPLLMSYGVGVGALAGFFGIGGGFLAVPGILAATGMPMIYAAGSSLLSVAVFGATTAANYMLSGLIDWRISALVLFGGVIGGVGGGALATRLADRKQTLRQIFAAMIAGVGFYVIARGVLALAP
jgi:uncharacterized membrane protein YfcA